MRKLYRLCCCLLPSDALQMHLTALQMHLTALGPLLGSISRHAATLVPLQLQPSPFSSSIALRLACSLQPLGLGSLHPCRDAQPSH